MGSDGDTFTWNEHKDGCTKLEDTRPHALLLAE
jgi:hypothetical protein